MNNETPEQQNEGKTQNINIKVPQSKDVKKYHKKVYTISYSILCCIFMFSCGIMVIGILLFIGIIGKNIVVRILCGILCICICCAGIYKDLMGIIWFWRKKRAA